MSDFQVVSIRMPKPLHKKIKDEAKRSHRTFSQQALYLLELGRGKPVKTEEVDA